MRFVGIDLAWSLHHTERPETGAVVLDERGSVLRTEHLGTDDSIVELVTAHTDAEGCIVAIDAPLVVPNETGQRPCEAALQAAGISVYPANRSLFERTLGGVRGEELVRRLREHGFQLCDRLQQGVPVRACLEVYPRATIRRLWGRIPTYKGSKAKAGVLVSGLERLQTLILTELDPPLHWAEPPLPAQRTPGRLLGQLKQRGDLLDAALAAWVGYAAWLPGPQRVETFGTVADGFIVVPLESARRSVRSVGAGAAATETDQDRYKALFRRYVELWNRGAVDELDQVLSPEFQRHAAAPGGEDWSAGELRAAVEALRRWSKRPVLYVEDQLADGDRVASRLLARPAEGSTGGTPLGLDISRFEGGKLAEAWETWTEALLALARARADDESGDTLPS
ncbi:MAG: DUF429 domain-containing protein [Chloroflexota bacterium]|nr:DUF429 domain-containing protein [Chloroflexota bacterium]